MEHLEHTKVTSVVLKSGPQMSNHAYGVWLPVHTIPNDTS